MLHILYTIVGDLHWGGRGKQVLVASIKSITTVNVLRNPEDREIEIR